VIEKWCDLNGPVIRFRATDTSLLTPLLESWALPETGPAKSADFTLDIVHGPFAAAPDEAPLLFSGLVPTSLPCVVRQVGTKEHYAIDMRASLLLGEREGLLTIVPGEETLARSSVVFQAVNAALRLDDQCFLHAAALALPESESAILIFGPSGFGKTTTALSLLPVGFRLLTDDASIVKRAAGGDRVWGLPRPLKVHERSASMLPWLAPVLAGQWNAQREQQVTPAELSRLLGVAPPHQQPRAIAAIIVLGKRSEDDHRMRSLTKADALAAIVSDNISRNLNGISEQQQARMRRIAEFLTGKATYELIAGPDLQSLPGAVISGLS
jgi:hypothetical protein